MKDAYDLVVVGSGAAGMTAALVAAQEGRQTLLIEKSAKVGGTSARSGGAIWIPNNPCQATIGMKGDAEMAREYLDALVGVRADPALRSAFVERGPEMLRYLEARTEVRFDFSPDEPDYRQEIPGAVKGGRALRAQPFDGRLLGPSFDRIADPLPELMVFGGMMVTRAEVARLVNFSSSWGSFVLASSLFARYLADRTRYKRGTRLVLGNALIARLFKELLDRKVTIWYESRVVGLITDGDSVGGVLVEREGGERRVSARCGVILAGGGFPASPALRRRFLPAPVAEYTAAAEGCTGDTLLLAERVGAALKGGGDNAYWFPSSISRRRDGTIAIFPHIALDRPKPGLIAVNAAGKRFVNEASSYHQFVRGMYRSHRTVPSIPAVLVCDRRFLWKYGLGLVHPHALLLHGFLKSGYLARGKTLEELATRINVEPKGLVETVARHNHFAATGIDEDFDKGGNAYDRAGGDPAHAPNSCIGFIDAPPYYAVTVVPTPLATGFGVRVNTDAQALGADDRVIPGLYACGNDMEPIAPGEYPGPGAQIGPAMTFGYIAAMHASHSARGNEAIAHSRL